ncbi:MAG: outer membrane beta-barrel domain-containing protein [Oceanospirillaceae bacterium]|uniref:outer membrane beta-barrel domain-containing protein n=1 Tax=unclassified Thalassolituus TaxID=2624967 RepID=UPI000C680AF3|nr:MULTISPECIES: outer membrane beta-barrel domain-containing protein [unclassified Thalassolituus]MAS24793.1 outer membrane beta-barrel domain-containing protein [Oceanospirillaceae bacterium]MAY00910.1 outer membrane beta-barrel domain-containing protein [Oceanospirillaceae bacterium]MBL35003.1 outer membrane beta-barrel domain-containing protein [Oceanospirillaceae bacterium]MBS53024.1 outer membrane beta-barrel domain-containing protein [Oceanospirillaceae bacterium]|tara:strand:- start:1923 stop:2600 length:678 start_codon:yes stop_codon:yes gene_type:complete
MANWFQQLLLISVAGAGFALAPVTVSAAEDSNDGSVVINPIKIIEPDVQARKTEEAKIDNEVFEAGFFLGMISIEDFGTHPLYGVKASFHATEDFFLQANYGRSKAGRTSYETINGSGVDILTDSDRKYSYYDLLVGYNLFPGETFVTSKLTFNSAFYLVGGVGNTSFAGDEQFTMVFGTGYRIILSDWLTWNMDFRDHMFETELLSKKKTTHNIEFATGLTVFF